MPDSIEKLYLAELIRDFGTEKVTDPEEALQLIQSMYRALEFSTESYITYLKGNKESFGITFTVWAKTFHRFLFQNILSNAGEYRKSSDKGGGIVLFGRDVHRRPSGSLFEGTHSDFIEDEMESIFKLLSADDHQPVRTSIQFYQKFVRIHPFYDANGRIARFLITIYLLFHGYYIEWKKLEGSKKNKFLDKLNACHLRERSDLYEEYLDYLYNFWKLFVTEKVDYSNQQH